MDRQENRQARIAHQYNKEFAVDGGGVASATQRGYEIRARSICKVERNLEKAA